MHMLFNHANLKVTYVTSTHVALDTSPHPDTKWSRKYSWTMAEQPLLATVDSSPSLPHPPDGGHGHRIRCFISLPLVQCFYHTNK